MTPTREPLSAARLKELIELLRMSRTIQNEELVGLELVGHLPKVAEALALRERLEEEIEALQNCYVQMDGWPVTQRGIKRILDLLLPPSAGSERPE